MSTFTVKIETIDTVRPHSNADRLDIATLVGCDYQFIVGRGSYKPGDKALYFPLDAIIPVPVLEKMSLAGKLAGPMKNRVKTIKLRGEYSQGLVGSLDLIPSNLPIPNDVAYLLDGDFSGLLGVTKYEPDEANASVGGGRHQSYLPPLPEFVTKYDLENAERVKAMVNDLMDKEVVITEKVEGSHYIATYYPGSGRLAICSRNHELTERTPYTDRWFLPTDRHNIKGVLEKLTEKFGGMCPRAITIRAEVIGPGIQNNIYKLDQHDIRAFEIEVDGRPVDAGTFFGTCEEFGLPTVPVLHIGTVEAYLAGSDIRTMSDGPSRLNTAIPREGIVIRPTWERRTERGERVIFKQRSPAYLALELV